MVVLTEYRKGNAGDEISAILRDLGLCYQVGSVVQKRNTNTALIASRYRLGNFDVDLPKELSAHVACAMLGELGIFAAFCATVPLGNEFLVFLEAQPANVIPMLATGDFYFGPRGSNPDAGRKLSEALKPSWVDLWAKDNLGPAPWSHRGSRGVSCPDHAWATQEVASHFGNVRYLDDPLERRVSDHAPMLFEVESCAIGVSSSIIR